MGHRIHGRYGHEEYIALVHTQRRLDVSIAGGVGNSPDFDILRVAENAVQQSVEFTFCRPYFLWQCEAGKYQHHYFQQCCSHQGQRYDNLGKKTNNWLISYRHFLFICGRKKFHTSDGKWQKVPCNLYSSRIIHSWLLGRFHYLSLPIISDNSKNLDAQWYCENCLKK